MKFKTVIKVFVIAFLLFLLTVSLGLKFNWVKYLKDEPEGQEQGVGLGLEESNQALGGAATEAAVKKKPKEIPVEIVGDAADKNVNSATAKQIKDDCIRASRRAGVGDSEIHAVVKKCVQMTLQAQGTPAAAKSNESPTDSNTSLTRGACEMVVANKKDLKAEEKESLIEQCIKDNSE